MRTILRSTTSSLSPMEDDRFVEKGYTRSEWCVFEDGSGYWRRGTVFVLLGTAQVPELPWWNIRVLAPDGKVYMASSRSFSRMRGKMRSR